MRQSQTDIDIRPPPKEIGADTALYDTLAALLTSGDAPDEEDSVAYLAELASYDIAPAKKAELIHILWQLVQTLVGIRFGLHPAFDAIAERNFDRREASLTMVELQGTPNTQFSAAATGESEQP